MDSSTLEQQVRRELLVIRKSRFGLGIETLTEAPVITGLLGEGNTHLAYNQLMRYILSSDLDLPVKAAAASLGLASDKDTHLGRLVEFGEEVHLDQRQVRRYSDKGIATIAKLIATSWTTTGTPSLEATLIRSGLDEITLAIATHRLFVVEMQAVEVTLLRGGEQTALAYLPDELEDDEDWWVHQVPTAPFVLQRRGQESVRIVWKGEMWPKIGVATHGNFSDTGMSFEVLGTTLMFHLQR
ncbi:hypothetical protein D1871_23025 [Nakamurella silvestris]|nr:hypothetical protein D1871_23025 [Nakamurella silvestris]